MNSFILAFDAIAPIFLMIILGYLAKKAKLIGPIFVTEGTKFVFRVSLPVMVFLKVSSIDVKHGIEASQFHLLIFCAVAIVITYLIAKLIGKWVIKEHTNDRGNVLGSFMQGAFRCNFLIVGYPILFNLYGDEVVINIALLTLLVIPMFNVLSICALTASADAKGIKKYAGVVINIMKNPLIIAVVLGFISAFLKVDYPVYLREFFEMAAKLATPLGLIAIGAFFHFDDFKDTLRKTLGTASLKLIIYPVVVSIVAYFIGFSQMDIIIVCVLFGGPTAVSSFAMSKELGGDPVLSGNIVIVTSALCMFSLMLIIAGWLQFLG